MSRFLGADVTALASIAGGTLVGGLAMATMVSGSDQRDRSAMDLREVNVECAAEVTPRVVVSHNSSRVVVAPNVRIGIGSSCADGSQEIHVMSRRGKNSTTATFHVRELDADARQRMEEARERIAEAQVQMERARERVEVARERMDRTRLERLRRGDDVSREAASLEALRSAERVLEQRLRRLEGEGLDGLDDVVERMSALEVELRTDLDERIRADVVREMRALRVELDRVQAESRGGGN